MFSFTKYVHYFLNKELSELYLSVAIRTFALSLISIFVPIYMLNLGYSLVDVLGFYIIYYIFHGTFSFFAAKLSLKIGFKHSMILTVPFLILFYILLYTITTYNWPLALLALVGAINNAIFWIAFHVDFVKSSVKRKRGEELSIFRVITYILNIFGPLLGAVVISFMNFHYLFVLVSILLVFSLVPLFFSKDIRVSKKISFKKIFRVQSWKNSVVFFGNGIETATGGVIWPVFIFLIVGGYLSLGIIASVATFFSLISVLAVGRLCDKFKRRSILKVGSVTQSAAWFFKLFVTTGPEIILVNTFSGIVNSLKDLPLNIMLYDKADKRNVVEFIVFREIVIALGRIALFSIIAVLLALSGGLILASLASLSYLLF